MSPLPTVSPKTYSEDDLTQVDELLALGARRGLTAGVAALRRALDAQRAFLALAGDFQYLVPARAQRAPAPERRRPGAVLAAENAQEPPCTHSHPTRGKCLRTRHPNAPRAHEYFAGEVVTRRAATVPTATFSARAS